MIAGIIVISYIVIAVITGTVMYQKTPYTGDDGQMIFGPLFWPVTLLIYGTMAALNLPDTIRERKRVYTTRKRQRELEQERHKTAVQQEKTKRALAQKAEYEAYGLPVKDL